MSTVDRVQRTVMADMLSGDLAPGTWMRQEELAARMGVSKIPVREALQRLAAIGLLRFEPNRGAVVPSMSLEEAEENFALRRVLEPRLLRQAVSKLTIVDLAEAELALSSDSAGSVAGNWRFHRALYAASGWDRGVAMVEILYASVAPYVLLYTRELGGQADSDAEHDLLLAACRGGETERACAILDQHLADAASTLANFLGSTPRRTPT